MALHQLILNVAQATDGVVGWKKHYAGVSFVTTESKSGNTVRLERKGLRPYEYGI